MPLPIACADVLKTRGRTFTLRQPLGTRPVIDAFCTCPVEVKAPSGVL